MSDKTIEEVINEALELIKGYNTDPNVIDQRVKALVITKLEEALLWATKLTK